MMCVHNFLHLDYYCFYSYIIVYNVFKHIFLNNLFTFILKLDI